MNPMLLRMLLTVSLGLTIVLIARKPMRRVFGAGPVFTLWCLPWLLAIIPWLPMPSASRTWSLQPIISALPVQTLASVHQASIGMSSWLFSVWLIGVAVGALQLAVRYRRLWRECRALPDDMRRRLLVEHPTLIARHLRLHDAGPAVMWAPRPRLLLPADFMQRYDSETRAMMLQHECCHLRRGDAWWRLGSELALVLLWFHPLIWMALPRFRLDQELACDESVLRATPHHELRYAHALMQSTGVDAQPAMIPWLAEPQLKERLTMISRQPLSPWRRRFGYITLIAMLASSAALAQNGVTPASDTPPSQDMSYNTAYPPPPYPADALKNREQGLVLLKVLVGTDGTAQKINVDPRTKVAPELTKAASDAAIKWHYNPAMKNGKAVEGWVQVPVMFSLTPLPPHPPGPPHGGNPPPPPPPGDMPPPPPPPSGNAAPPTSSNS